MNARKQRPSTVTTVMHDLKCSTALFEHVAVNNLLDARARQGDGKLLTCEELDGLYWLATMIGNLTGKLDEMLLVERPVGDPA